MSQIVTRFAPSPTGYLHIGGLRTALFNYLYARANGGKFLLRIEDTDLSRNCVEATKAIIEAFDWVGLDYDGEVVYQSQRLELYRTYIQKLLDLGKAYYCYMSKEELDSLRESQRQRGETPRYDNRYRDFKGSAPEGIKPVVRLKTPLAGNIEFDDGVKGHITINASEIDDYIIARSDGTPTYNFVVAIDDALMGVTDVIRGDDHLSNTPKQILIYQAFGWKIPKFYHVPMILNPQGKKLSKRDGAMGVMDYQRMGYLPQAILNFLVRLGWSYHDQEIFSLQEMLAFFDPRNLNTSASAYNQEKFLWLNQHYIKQTSDNELENLLSTFGVKAISEDKREVLYNELKNRSQTLCEFATHFAEVMNPPQMYDEKMRKKLDQHAKIWLETISKDLAQIQWDIENLEQYLHHFASSHNIKLGQLMPALRCVLLGKSGGIGIAQAMYVLGLQECQKRIEVFNVQDS